MLEFPRQLIRILSNKILWFMMGIQAWLTKDSINWLKQGLVSSPFNLWGFFGHFSEKMNDNTKMFLSLRIIFYFLIRVLTLLIGILSSLDIFLYPFPLLCSPITFSHRSFDVFFCFPHDAGPRDVSARVWQEPRNSLNLYAHTDYKQTDDRWGWLPFF